MASIQIIRSSFKRVEPFIRRELQIYENDEFRREEILIQLTKDSHDINLFDPVFYKQVEGFCRSKLSIEAFDLFQNQ